MSESRTTSTLDLVVNEQQRTNMSQINLNDPQLDHRAPGQIGGEPNNLMTRLRAWPMRMRAAFQGKLDETRAKSDSTLDFCLKLGHEFAIIFAWSFCFMATVLAPVVFLLSGLLAMGACAASPALPYVVFSCGFVMTLSNLFNFSLACDLPILRNQELLSEDLKNIIASLLNVIFNAIALFLYIMSAHLVLRLDAHANLPPPSTNPDNGTESNATDATNSSNCEPFLYHFTFWFVVATIAVLVALCLLALIIYAYNKYRLALVRGTQETSHSSIHITTPPPPLPPQPQMQSQPQMNRVEQQQQQHQQQRTN